MKFAPTLLLLLALLTGSRWAMGQATPIDSLEAVLRAQPKGDTTRVKTLLMLVFEYKNRDLDRADTLVKEALSISQRIGYQKGIAKSWRFKAMLGFFSGDLAAAEAAVARSRRLYQQIGDSAGLAEAFGVSGALYLAQGHLESAGEMYVRALRLQEKYGEPKGVAQALANLGQVMLGMRRFGQAITYYEQYTRVPGSLSKPTDAVNIYLSLGAAHWRLHHDTTATRFLMKALTISKQIGDVRGEGTAHMELGQFQLERKSYQSSRLNIERAIRIFEQLHLLPQAGKAHAGLGDASIKLTQYKEAVAEFQKALKIATEIGDDEGRATAYDGLARAYIGLNNVREALTYQRLAAQWQDSILTSAGIEKVAELQTRYETEKKESQNRLQATQLRVQQQVIRRRNVQLRGGLVIGVLLLGLGYSLYTRRRLGREVEFAQERQQLERLRSQAVLEAEEAERRRIGADLHDGVGQLLTAAKLNLHALGEQLGLETAGQQTMLQNALDVVDESFKEVRSISHNLMPNALIKRGLAQAVRDFLSKIAPDDRLKIQLEVVGLDRGGRLEATVENVLFRVIQELAQNIVKHARATQMTLQIIRGAGELTIMVEDNGVGFAPAAQEAGAGIGLKNIASRMAYLGGRAEFDSSPGRGTTVTLEVPLAAPPAEA